MASKSSVNLCNELRHIFQQRGLVRLKRMAAESPQTPRLRPKALILDYEDSVQTSQTQSKSKVYMSAARRFQSFSKLSIPSCTVCYSTYRYYITTKSVSFGDESISLHSSRTIEKFFKEGRIPSNVRPTVKDNVTKVTITVEFPSKTVRKELSAELLYHPLIKPLYLDQMIV